MFVVLFPLTIYITHPKTKISHKNIIFLTTFISTICISSIFNGNAISAPLLILSGVFIGLYLITKYTFLEVVKCFSNIILIISILSLAIWFGCNAKIISLHKMTNIAESQVFSAFGFIYYSVLGDTILRNSAIFREPGVYMIMINLSIIFELFIIKEKKRWINIGILTISMISLLSTGGIICLALIYIIYLIRSKKGIPTLIILALVLIIFIIPKIDEDYINLVFLDKFNEMETSGSGFARMSSFFIPLEIFLDYPIIGCGYKDFETEYIQHGLQLYNRYVDPHGLSSNTIMNIFAVWGFIIGGLILYGLYKLSKLITYGESKIISYLVLTAILIMFSNESMPYWPFLYIYIIYGISEKNPYKIIFAYNE